MVPRFSNAVLEILITNYQKSLRPKINMGELLMPLKKAFNKKIWLKNKKEISSNSFYSSYMAKRYFGVDENLAQLLMTLLTDSKKSFSEASFRRALIANIPASVHTLRSSAPEIFILSKLYQWHCCKDEQSDQIEYLFPRSCFLHGFAKYLHGLLNLARRIQFCDQVAQVSLMQGQAYQADWWPSAP